MTQWNSQICINLGYESPRVDALRLGQLGNTFNDKKLAAHLQQLIHLLDEHKNIDLNYLVTGEKSTDGGNYLIFSSSHTVLLILSCNEVFYSDFIVFYF